MQIRRLLVGHAAAAVILLGAYGWLVRDGFYQGRFDYDESDYVFVTNLGVAALATDTPTLSLPEFVRIGLNRRTGDRTALSELIRDANDTVFYRHWHGPVFFYWLT